MVSLRTLSITICSSIIVLVMGLGGISTAVHAADFYFDSINGNDSTGDGSEGNPWQTIVKIQETVHCNAGATIYLRAGSEWDANDLDFQTPCGLNLLKGVTEGLALYQDGITIQSYGTGAKPRIINPRPGVSNAHTILVQGNNITLDGLHIDDRLDADSEPVYEPGATTNTANGVYVYQGTNAIIRNMEIEHVGHGVVLEGSNALVTNNHVHNTQMVVNTNNGGDDDSGAVGVLILTSNNEISYNNFESNRAPSYDFAPTFEDGGAIEIYVPSGDTIVGNYIHHNTATGNEGFIEFGGQSTSAVGENTISYNLLKNNRRLFYFNLSGTFALTSVTGLRVYNNTLVEENASLYGYFISASATPATEILDIRNSIFYFDNSLAITDFSTGITSANNVFYEFNGVDDPSIVGYTPDATDVIGNPLFTNTASDYTLQVSSPALNSGATLGTVTTYTGSTVAIQATDLNGTAVPVDSSPERGAYEYPTVITATPTPSPIPTVTPVPSTPPDDGEGGDSGNDTNTGEDDSTNGSRGQVNSASDNRTAGPPSCTAGTPSLAPELFQINAIGSVAELFIKPAGNPYNQYFISYSFDPRAEQWGVSFPITFSDGAIQYLLKDLPRGKTIYVKVRAGNGCMPGEWSNTMQIKTGKERITVYTLNDQQQDSVDGFFTSVQSLWQNGVQTLLHRQ